jgi:hypothetical protein
MRFVLAMLAAVLATPAAAQTSDPPPPAAYPMPPPPAPPAVVTAPDGHVTAPPRLDNFTDKASRCLQYGRSIGVPADKIEDYVKRCVQQ